VDTILSVHHLPSSGENLTLLPNYEPIVDVPGGKGCNQAIASSKLQSLMHPDKGGGGDGAVVSFIGQFGNDESTSSILRNALMKHNVDIKHSGQSQCYPCGRGYVILVPKTGEVCAIVSGGSNLFGWDGWRCVNNDDDDNDEHEKNEEKQHKIISDDYIRSIVAPYKLLLLQCEIPSFINLRLANIAHELSIPVILDAGGEDRYIEQELLDCVNYFIPNETELLRLVKHYNNNDDDDDDDDGSLLHQEMMSTQEVQEIQNLIGPTIQLQSLLQSVRTLQRHGASNVLVTLGSHGSILVKDCKKEKTQHQQLVTSSSSHCRNIIYQPSCPLLSLGLSVVDETGAGDCYRAGFAVALLEYCKLGSRGVDYDDGDVDDDGVLEQCMKFASAAGALAVTKSGAVPSIPTREEVDELLLKWSSFSSSVMTKKEVEEEHSSIMMVDNVVPRGGSDSTDEDESFPFLFGSRLNSMKDRTDLLSSSLPLSHPRDYVRRQATIRGLGCVDFNYPQHFEGYWSPEDAKVALDEVGLIAGAVCLRYPAKFARGAMNHPVASMRREAIEITKGAAEAARILGCNE
jgi:sugar/nucleoside kinase (ribokinase family)